MLRKISFIVALCVFASGCAQNNSTISPEEIFSNPAKLGVLAAATDSLSTGLAIAAGAREANPLVSTSAGGLISIFLIKSAGVYWIDKQPDNIRDFGLKFASGFWGGASINNLLIFAGMSNPVSIVGGVVGGILLYNHEASLLRKEKAEKALIQNK